MSREWRRAPADTMCGYCINRIVKADEPALYTKLPNVKRERVRCQSCAGEAAPELPDRVIVRSVEESAQVGFTKASMHAPGRTRGEFREAVRKEWTPYREPGEEG